VKRHTTAQVHENDEVMAHARKKERKEKEERDELDCNSTLKPELPIYIGSL
jgi:hypothetical protein